MFLRVILAALLLSVTLAPPAAARAPVAAPTTAKEDSDRLRADMEGQVERLRLNVETFLQAQDKRIGDLQFYGNMNNGLIALLAIVITVVVAVIAFKFAVVAVQEAEVAVRNWIEKEGKKLLDAQVEQFHGQMRGNISIELERALAQIREEAEPHLKQLQITAEMAQSWGALRKDAGGAVETDRLREIILSPEKLRNAAAEATGKPEEKRTFDDWYVLAWNLVDSKDPEAAAKRFLRAASGGHSNRGQLAKAFYNAAMCWRDAGQFEQALSALDEAIKVAPPAGGDDEMLSIISEARFARGWQLSKLDKFDEAIKAYDDHIRAMDSFSDRQEIRVNIAQSQLNRANVLARIGDLEGAVASYDDLIARYQHEQDEAFRTILGKAMFNRSLRLKTLGRRDAAVVALEGIIREFGAQAPAGLASTLSKTRALLEKEKAARRTPPIQEPADV